MANIFFDFDGTLIDPKTKLYRLFIDLTFTDAIGYEEYWKFKRAKYSNEWILINRLTFDKEKINHFKEQWMKQVEAELYLQWDQKFSFTDKVLDNLPSHNLYVITGRQFAKPVIAQAGKFNLLKFFKKILVTEHKYSKKDLVINAGIMLSDEDIFIGDSEEDIMAATELGITSVGVLTGVRDRKSLEKASPHFISENIELFFQSHFNEII